MISKNMWVISKDKGYFKKMSGFVGHVRYAPDIEHAARYSSSKNADANAKFMIKYGYCKIAELVSVFVTTEVRLNEGLK